MNIHIIILFLYVYINYITIFKLSKLFPNIHIMSN